MDYVQGDDGAGVKILCMAKLILYENLLKVKIITDYVIALLFLLFKLI
jgi:hypothetical protein